MNASNMNDHFEPDPVKRFDIVGPAKRKKYPHIGDLVLHNDLNRFRLKKPRGAGIIIGLDYDYEDGVPIFWVSWPDFLSWEGFADIRKIDDTS